MSGSIFKNYNPDVLTCIANLSNDEVFTPPQLAKNMLDRLEAAWAVSHHGENIWSNPTIMFLDPAVKTGIFLREITSRLIVGLEEVIPDLQERVNHIATRQVFGIAITQLTALLARRSVYCSKSANGEYSVVRNFNSVDGNIWFTRTEHTWFEEKNPQRCYYCGAKKDEYDRGPDLETHAYGFIHTDDISAHLKEIFSDKVTGGTVKFDVIIGNPPYQLADGGHNASASPIYQKFVETALDLEPQYAVFVTPSRWFAGGKGLDEYRRRMLSDHHLRTIVDYPKLYEAFPGVKIRGGVSYFLWDKHHDGPCEVQTIIDGKPTGTPVARYLDEYDVLIRRNEAVSILNKVTARGEKTLNHRVSSAKPFGLRTFFKGNKTPRTLHDPVKLYANQRIDWVEREEIHVNTQWIDRWKVLMTRVQGTSGPVETKFLSQPIVAAPGTASTETYLVAGHFDTEEEAQSYASYLRTRFVRFLVSLRKSTQDAPRRVYAFVPDVPYDRTWTDTMLYERYGITHEEIEFIESIVHEHENTTSSSSNKK